MTGALALGAARLAAQSPPANVDDQGEFERLVEGRPVGTEKFEIRAVKDGFDAHAEVHLRVVQNGKTIEGRSFPRLTLNAQLRPLVYTWSQKGTQSSELSVDFRVTPAKTTYKTVNGQEDNRTFQFLPDVAVLDENVVHHYQLLVDRYRQTSGGKQTFHVFVPQEATPGDVTVEDAGAEPIDVGGKSLNLHHLVVTAELARVDIWVDDQQRIEKLSIPDAHFDAVRKR